MGDKSYKWNAKAYEDNSSAQQKWARELIPKLKLQGDERVLDIGCAEGKVTIEIAEALPDGSVIGIDNSEAMINLARNRYPEEKYPNARFYQEDASYLHFQNEFDVVFSNATLHWIQDHRPVLKGINQSLKSKGRILLQMGGKGNGKDVITAADQVIQSDKWRKYFTDFNFTFAFYSPEEYRKWLNLAGLHPIRAELIPKDMAHENPGAFAGWLGSVFHPYLEPVPKPNRREFISEIVNMYLDKHPVDSEGRTHTRMVRLEVEAVKDQ